MNSTNCYWCRKRESVFINSYSKYKKKGVPKSKSPIPKIDWKIDKNIIDIISTVIFIKNIKYTKFQNIQTYNKEKFKIFYIL